MQPNQDTVQSNWLHCSLSSDCKCLPVENTFSSRAILGLWAIIFQPLLLTTTLPCLLKAKQNTTKQTKQRVCFDCYSLRCVFDHQLKILSLGFLRRIRDMIWTIIELPEAEKNAFNIKSDFKIWAKYLLLYISCLPKGNRYSLLSKIIGLYDFLQYGHCVPVNRSLGRVHAHKKKCCSGLRNPM